MLRNEVKLEKQQMDIRLAHGVREATLQLAAEAGFSPGLSWVGGRTRHDRHFGETELTSCDTPSQDANNDGGTHGQPATVNIKTPKFSGKRPWEVFIAQFELLAVAAGWSDEHKAVKKRGETILL
ncbi:hypothetical protein ILYODFUR_025342 [Ilyodon furcidens]|uniref:Uncharacterized protein n=1 Tax=Ilyodon furcidens TaxID=33524 RepID=A0ABV0T1I1_9TELE